jgi:HK97 family phage major capsid protein
MMHQSARKALRKLKDSQGRPLWEPSLQAGFADSLLGYPTRINNDMATVAQNSRSPALRQHPRGLRHPDRAGAPRCG